MFPSPKFSPLRSDIAKSALRGDVLLASLGLNIAGLALPIMILQVYDRVLRNHSLTTLAFLALFTFMAFGVEFLLRILRARIQAAAAARFDHRASLRAFENLLHMKREDFEKSTSTDHLNAMRGIQKVRDFYYGQAMTLLIDVPFVVVSFALIAFIAGPLLAAPLAIAAALLGMSWALSRRLAKALEDQETVDSRRYNFLIEVLRGIHAAKALSLEETLARRHERLQGGSGGAVEWISLINATSISLSTFFSQAATAIVVSFGAVLAVTGNLTIGGLAAVTMLTGRSLQPIMRGTSYWTKYQAVRRAAEKAGQLVGGTRSAAAGGTHAPARLHVPIRAENVALTIPGTSQPLFADVSLRIPAGAMIGISGPNASGKTSLLKLIAGKSKPDSGRLYLGEHPLEDHDEAVLRDRIAHITGDDAIFAGTLLENVAMFQKGDAESRAIDAIRLIGLDRYVSLLPRGLDTPLGGSDVAALPPGIRGQILIARALARDPDIILFDGANKGLDIDADRRVHEVLLSLKRRKTIILVSQRPSYLEQCDALYELRDGTLVQSRSYTEAARAAETGNSAAAPPEGPDAAEDASRDKGAA